MDHTSAPAQSILHSDALEELRLFDVMGVTGSAEQEEKIVNEIAEGIRQQFLAEDVSEQLSEEALDELDDVLSDAKLAADPQQHAKKMMETLEKYIPDLKQKLQRRTLEFKQDILLERVSGLHERFEHDTNALTQVSQIEEYLSQGKWADAVHALNSLVPPTPVT